MPDRFVKDPDAVLDYQINWLAWLDGDSISASVWEVPTGITADSDSSTASTATVWLSSGTAGESYLVVNRITTDGGRTDDRSITISVAEK